MSKDTTIGTAAKFTAEQLDAFKRYEHVRRRGAFNMLDRRAIAATGLQRDVYFFVLDNYEALRDAAGSAGATQ